MKFQVQRMVVFVVVSSFVFVSHSAHAADPNGYLYIAHAAAGRNISSVTNPAYPVDISIGGDCVAQGLSFGEIRGPFTMPGGSYAVVVSVANSGMPCSNSAVYSATISLSAGTASLGIVTVDTTTHQVGATVKPIDLSAVSTTLARVVVANVTQSPLTGALFHGDSTSPPAAATAEFAPNSVSALRVPVGEWTFTVNPQGSTGIATGPLELDFVARNVYLLVLAGSISNSSVQLVGPAVIGNVF